MKAILISLMVIGLVGGMIGGGMFAYFSDTETSTGNTFTAGTIDITVTGGGVVTGSNGTQVEFKPCEWGYLDYVITNIGENPAKVYKHIKSLVGSQGAPSGEPELEADPGDTIVPTAANFDFDLTVNSVEVIPQTQPVPLTSVISHWIYLGTVEKGQTITVRQSFHLLDTGVPQNELQGDVATIDEEYLALQVPGTVVPPGPMYP
jgi:predicted ribosomally synthesized peptide with SipW-like signal peptide